MEQALKKQVHDQLLRTFKHKSKKGYCWLLSKFGNTTLDYINDETGQRMLQCLEAKELGIVCPVHIRRHEGRAAKQRVVA